MTIQYYPEVDTLTITLVPAPYPQEDVRDTGDDDVLLLYDAEGHLAEVEVSHASTRVNLEALRRDPHFEEVQPEAKAAKP